VVAVAVKNRKTASRLVSCLEREEWENSTSTFLKVLSLHLYVQCLHKPIATRHTGTPSAEEPGSLSVGSGRTSNKTSG